MKKRKSYYLLFLSLMILIGGGASLSSAKESGNSGGRKLEKLYANEQQSVVAEQSELKIQDELNSCYSQIEKEMGLQDTVTETSGETVDAEADKYLPDYAGAYIENDKLIVCLTEKSKDIQLNNTNVKYKIVDYSYNKLSKIKRTLSKSYEKLYGKYENQSEEFNLLNSMTGIGIDEEKNRVVVDIVDLTEQKQELFDELFGKIKGVELQKTESRIEDCATYQPGRGIYVITKRNGSSITYAKVSIGYRAYRLTSNGGKYGFATCAHDVNESVDKKIYSDSSFNTVVGKILKWKESGSVDAAFVEIADGNIVGTTVKYSDSAGNTSPVDTIATRKYMTAVPKGSTVYKVGATTYKTSGKVILTDCDFTVEGKTFTNLTKTDVLCKSGDSGGIFYTYFEGKYCPAGLVKGTDNVYSLYVKASEAANAMDMYPY